MLLPAPFGPINAVSEPARTLNETSATACTPPNDFVTLVTVERVLLSFMLHASAGSGLGVGAAARPPESARISEVKPPYRPLGKYSIAVTSKMPDASVL